MKTKQIVIQVYYRDVKGVGLIQTYEFNKFIPLTDKQSIIGYKIIER